MALLDLADYDVPSEDAAVEDAVSPLPQMTMQNGPDEGSDLLDDTGTGDLGLDEEVTTRRSIAPRAKMDGDRLLGDRGLPVLHKFVNRVKFKGKGHEKRDLSKLLATYQLWGHRLFPKANFDDFIELAWRAGHGGPVRAYRNERIEEEKYGGDNRIDVTATEHSEHLPEYGADRSGDVYVGDIFADDGPPDQDNYPFDEINQSEHLPTPAPSDSSAPGIQAPQRDFEFPDDDELTALGALQADDAGIEIHTEPVDLTPLLPQHADTGKPLQRDTSRSPEPAIIDLAQPEAEPEPLSDIHQEALDAYGDLGF